MIQNLINVSFFVGLEKDPKAVVDMAYVPRIGECFWANGGNDYYKIEQVHWIHRNGLLFVHVFCK